MISRPVASTGITGFLTPDSPYTRSAQRARRRDSRSAAAEHRGADVDARDRRSRSRADERRARIEKARAADGRAEDRRHHPGRRHVAQLLHRHPLGQQRAPDRRRHPEVGNPVHRHAGVRRRSRRASSSPADRSSTRTSRSGRRTRVRSTRVAQGLKDRGIATGRIGVEETTKFVFADSIGGAAPALKVVSATPITAGCRMIKDAHEIELMQRRVRGDAQVLRGGLPRAQARHDAERSQRV